MVVMEATIMPYALKLIVDGISQFEGNRNNILSVILYPLLLYFSARIFMVIVFRFQHWLGNTRIIPEFNADMRMALFQYVQHHSHAYFSNNFAGSLANKIGDLPRSSITVFQIMRWRVITTLSVTIASLVIVSTVNIIFSMILLTWFLVQFSTSYYFAKRIHQQSQIYAEDLSILAGKIVDILSNINTVRLFSRMVHENEYVMSYQNISKKSFQKNEFEFWKLTVAMELAMLTMFAAVFYYLITGWQQSRISTGDFVLITFISANIITYTWQLGMELANLFKEIGICQQALKLITASHTVTNIENAPDLHVPHGRITFENVKFCYVKGTNIFRDKNLTIKAGEKVGLVGSSGSGKTTFVDLVLRLYDLEAGQIRIDGHDISQVTQESLRNNIAIIPQNPSLFHRSLIENIRYGRLDATDAQVIKASKQAHCHEFISELEHGYNTLVGERGTKLSGGQRQRISIARAILKNAPILILDEATSSLDSITERYIQESLQTLIKDKTTIVIAHRLSTLTGMDRIIVFKNGNIIEDGPHHSLLHKKEYYYHLWNTQVDGVIIDGYNEALTIQRR